MHDAAKAGDINKVRSMLDSGADVNAKGYADDTPLHEAVKNRRTETTKLLIKHGADVNAKNIRGNTPLHKVAMWDNVEIAKFLIGRGADVNAKNNHRSTPLHSTIFLGHTEVAKLLIESGADINAKTNYGSTTLHRAADGGKTKLVKLLIELGANTNAKNNKGQTALDIARLENKPETVAGLQTAISEKQVKAKKKEKKRIAALKKKQKCRMKESKWIYMSKSCRGKYASGKGVAVHVDGKLKFKGTIKNGRRISGELFYDGQPMFDGPIAKGKPSGKGICYYENEPEKCEFYRGKRVDGIFKQRVAMAKQKAEMQQLRAEMKKDMNDLKASQTAAGSGTQTDSMGNIIKKEIVRQGVNELFNQLF